MEQPSQTYTSIINALQGVKGDEIELTAPPTPIDPLQAENLSAYIFSILVPTYRTRWAAIDDQTVAPKPSMNVDASVPAFHEEALLLEVIEEKWDIRIWARTTINGDDTPVFGFTMMPRITNLTLFIYTWLLLPTTEREHGWEIYHRSSDGAADTQLSWRSLANNPVVDGDYIILNPNKVPIVALGETDLPWFPIKEEESRTKAVSVDRSYSTGLVSFVSSWDDNSDRAVLHRDQWCQANGRLFNTWLGELLGDPDVARIVPFARPDLADTIRWTLDPQHVDNEQNNQRLRTSVNQHPANKFRVMKNLGALMKKCCWTVDPFQQPMILRVTRGLHSIGRPKEEDIQLYYGSLVFPHPRQDAPASADSEDSESDNTESSSDTAESIPVGEVPAVNPTALLMHLISTLREKCMIVQRKREEPFEIIHYPRPPTDELVDRVQLWLQGLYSGAEDPVDSLISHDESQAQ